MITRREILYLGAGLAAFAAPSLLSNGPVRSPLTPRFQRSLPIPPVLKPVRTDSTTDYYEITQRESDVEILPGLRTRIWGSEGMLPGPTIQARQAGCNPSHESTRGSDRCTPSRRRDSTRLRRLSDRHDFARPNENLRVPEQPKGGNPLVSRPRNGPYRKEHLHGSRWSLSDTR